MAVVDQVAAELCKVKVGGTILLPDVADTAPTPEMFGMTPVPPPTPSPGTTPASGPATVPTIIAGSNPVAGIGRLLKLTVVGIVHKPTMMAEMRPTIYLPLATLQAFKHRPGKVSRILVNLNRGEDSAAVAADLERRVIAAGGPAGLRYKSASETRKEMQKNFEGVRFLSYLGGAVSLVSAIFIVFSTLSMGVSERQRTLAMLRAIGASRGQLARLVVMEGLILAAVGVAVGLPLGWAWVKALTLWKPEFFTEGVTLSGAGMRLGSVGAMASAVVASLLPAWNASRVSPLEAMGPQANATAGRLPWVSALFGLALISRRPAGGLLRPPADAQISSPFRPRPAGAARRVLPARAAVCLARREGRQLAHRPLMGVPPALLRQQLTGGIWRWPAPARPHGRPGRFWW